MQFVYICGFIFANKEVSNLGKLLSHKDNIQYLQIEESIALELGGEFTQLQIAYHTYGELNESGDNVIWVFHALTASSKIEDWWTGSFGKDRILDSANYFIVCANLVGSCYGTTGPLDINPKTGEKFYQDFPIVSIRDQVSIFQLLKKHLGIQSIHLGVGGSMGACHAMEWSIKEPDLFKHLYLSVCSAKESSWGKAIHTAHRMAIESDATWKEKRDDAGIQGMKAARAIGMVIYRNYLCYEETQPDDDDTLTEFKAASYQRYQGEKLANRFNAFSYYKLLDSLDTHHVGRDREGINHALSGIKAKTVIVNINTDLLYPAIEQQNIVDAIPNAFYESINSIYGHDGFLVETDQLTKLFHKHFI